MAATPKDTLGVNMTPFITKRKPEQQSSFMLATSCFGAAFLQFVRMVVVVGGVKAVPKTSQYYHKIFRLGLKKK